MLGAHTPPCHPDRSSCKAGTKRRDPWLLAQGEDIVPIPGTKRQKYLEENAAAADITLSPEELQQINNAVPHGAVQGERYTPEMMQTVNR